MRERLRRPTMLLATVLALYGGGRFAMFFYRSDTEPLALGLNVAQVSSVVLVACGALLALRARRVYPPGAERSPRRPGRLAGDYVSR